MMASIMLVDSPPLDTVKLDLRWDPFLEKKCCFIKTKRFYENLGRDIPDPSEFIKWSYSGGVRFLENVFGWKKVLIKQHMVLCNYPLQHHVQPHYPEVGRGLVCSLSVLVWNTSYSYKG